MSFKYGTDHLCGRVVNVYTKYDSLCENFFTALQSINKLNSLFY